MSVGFSNFLREMRLDDLFFSILGKFIYDNSFMFLYIFQVFFSVFIVPFISPALSISTSIWEWVFPVCRSWMAWTITWFTVSDIYDWYYDTIDHEAVAREKKLRRIPKIVRYTDETCTDEEMVRYFTETSGLEFASEDAFWAYWTDYAYWVTGYHVTGHVLSRQDVINVMKNMRRLELDKGKEQWWKDYSERMVQKYTEPVCPTCGHSLSPKQKVGDSLSSSSSSSSSSSTIDFNYPQFDDWFGIIDFQYIIQFIFELIFY